MIILNITSINEKKGSIFVDNFSFITTENHYLGDDKLTFITIYNLKGKKYTYMAMESKEDIDSQIIKQKKSTATFLNVSLINNDKISFFINEFLLFTVFEDEDKNQKFRVLSFEFNSQKNKKDEFIFNISESFENINSQIIKNKTLI